MNFNFEKIKSKLSKAAVKTKETSGTMVEIAKLKYKLMEINSDIDENYLKLGKLVYSAEDDEDISDNVQIISDAITSLIEAKNDMQSRYDDLVSKKQCPKCGTRLEKEYDFCPKCGYSFEE